LQTAEIAKKTFVAYTCCHVSHWTVSQQTSPNFSDKKEIFPLQVKM